MKLYKLIDRTPTSPVYLVYDEERIWHEERGYLIPAPEAERAVRAWETIAAVLKKYEFTVEDLKGIAACLVAADEPTDAAVMDALADALVEAEGEE